MKLINQIVSLAPTPLFFVGGVVSLLHMSHTCGGFAWEMPIMWFVMSLAHVGNWIVFFERRRYVKLQQLPDKQQ